MKKLHISYILFSLLIASGCGKLLDVKPNDRYTTETFWDSEKKAMAGLAGCYAVLHEDGLFGYATPLWEETATPNAYNYDNSGGFGVIALGTHTATNATTGNITGGIIAERWLHCYVGIGRCNTLLANIDKVPVMADALKNRAKAEATFLRALYYSMLATYYGGVPLILDEPDLATQGKLPRNTREEVVTQVLKDLDAAAAVLPPKYTGNDIGRATKGAALALKARVLLFEASPLNNPSNDLTKWSDAAAAAKAVMDMASTAGYGLFPNYRQLFMPANENKQETVFDVQFTVSQPGYGSAFDLICRQYGTNAPLRDMIESYLMKDGLPAAESPEFNPANIYENRDPRMYQTIVYPGDTYLGEVTTPSAPFKLTGYGVKKYSIYDSEPSSNLINQAGRSEINYMVIRYADVLLMYAEAQNEAVGPDENVYKAIDTIRGRAGMPKLAADLTQEEMRAAIRQERRTELAFEGFYYNDIRRWKTAEVVMNAAIRNSEDEQIEVRSFDKTRDYWWPIPHTQRELNPNLEQNDKY
ncbi:RagB/SusD family nutrient uptake outer membrane protein [Chitinophaga cymbidii]|uniref:Membrane protein n=1 Tax=Chitinophaga cymbidii TaxID=1096750 RepID=A0A512RNI5_9BACT|nr:RagB/SusD family nutrient uptake outer membrane protein [Chitinophaga cymbidii]GEP97253.1 membrane protein [Chitinophaga cymbidii]